MEGAFVQGLGLQTMEEVVFDGEGRLVTTNTWDYKIPTPADIPRQLNVTFLKVVLRYAMGRFLSAITTISMTGRLDDQHLGLQGHCDNQYLAPRSRSRS